MFHRYVLLFVIASLAVSGGAAWAFDVFVNVNATNARSRKTFRPSQPASPPAGLVLWRGRRLSNANYYDVCYYPGTPSGTMTSMDSAFTYSGATFLHAVGGNMNDQGDFTSTVFQATPQVQWLTTNQGTNTTYYKPSLRAADNKCAASGSTTMTTSAARTPDAPHHLRRLSLHRHQ